MDRPVRIGLVGDDDRRLLADLKALPRPLEVTSFRSVFEDTEALVAFRADLLLVQLDESTNLDELAGALRFLKSLCPMQALVLGCDASREVELAALRERTGASWLALPHTPLDLARAVDHALNGGDRPRTEVFLDLVHGIADEINNPLQFVLGYLQLLQLQLEGDQYQDARDHIAAALDGGQRIAGTVERLTRIERAAAGARRHERFDLRTALESALAVSAAGRPLPSIVREPAKGSFVVQGDAEILDPALHALAAAAFEFEQHGGSVHFVLTRIDHAVRLRMALRGEGFADWQLPRTWEPYYLCRVLRGSTQGLALFLVQTAIHAHRGQATARRLPDGAVAIDLELPRT